MILFNNISEELIKNNIKPSIPRIKILEYFMNQNNHPNADQIYNDLKKENHALSKATVYNTLALFSEKGLLKVLTLENNEKRYDITTSCHGHFLCNFCKNIYDFSINIDGLNIDEMSNFIVLEKDVFLKGICPRCQTNNKR